MAGNGRIVNRRVAAPLRISFLRRTIDQTPFCDSSAGRGMNLPGIPECPREIAKTDGNSHPRGASRRNLIAPPFYRGLGAVPCFARSKSVTRMPGS